MCALPQGAMAPTSADFVDGEALGPIIKCGWLTKQGHFIKNWKRRMFILTSRFLLYCKEWPSSASQKRIPVAEVSEVGEEERKGHRVVAFRAGGATYYCYGDRNEDVDDWKYILNRTVRASAKSREGNAFFEEFVPYLLQFEASDTAGRAEAVVSAINELTQLHCSAKGDTAGRAAKHSLPHDNFCRQLALLNARFEQSTNELKRLRPSIWTPSLHAQISSLQEQLKSEEKGCAGEEEVKSPECGDTASGSKFFQHYSLGKKLGEGCSGLVQEAVHLETKQRFAVKTIERKGLSHEEAEQLDKQVHALKRLHHPHVVHHCEVYDDDPGMIYIVMELLEGGELFDALVERGSLSETEVKTLFHTVVDGVAYCHRQGIIHRDLRPENILLAKPMDFTSCKIVGFGVTHADAGASQGLSTTCGTPGYVAPEVLLQQSRSAKGDVWGLGVFLYILLCGYPPFYSTNQSELFEQIKTADYYFDPPQWTSVSEPAKDAVRKLLVADPSARLSADQILKLPWLKDSSKSSKDLPLVLQTLRKFNARRRLKASVDTVRGTIRFGRRSTDHGPSPSKSNGAKPHDGEEKQEEAAPPEKRASLPTYGFKRSGLP